MVWFPEPGKMAAILPVRQCCFYAPLLLEMTLWGRVSLSVIQGWNWGVRWVEGSSKGFKLMIYLLDEAGNVRIFNSIWNMREFSLDSKPYFQISISMHLRLSYTQIFLYIPPQWLQYFYEQTEKIPKGIHSNGFQWECTYCIFP